MTNAIDGPILVAEALGKSYGRRLGCRNVSLELHEGEVLAVVGESGSGKSTLLQLLSGQLTADTGRAFYRMRDGSVRNLFEMGEAERRFLARTDWGYVHQDPSAGLRMSVSGGANVGERLMGVGWRNYGRIRGAAAMWLERRDRGRADRRHAAHLLRWHAPASADRAQSGDAAASGLHG
jgi:putative phosphonate transport system ATP-binding protein